jgi:hypothetical protein
VPVYALRFDLGDDYDVELVPSEQAPRVGDELDARDARWRVEEQHELHLNTPDGEEHALQLVCRRI